MRNVNLGKWLRTYLLLGVLWCLMTNLIAAMSGAVSPVAAASGAAAGSAKVVAVTVAIARQIVIWPFEVYERVIRPLFV